MSDWPVSTIVDVSMLIGAVLILRGPIARAFGAAGAYALWVAPLARLMTPPISARSLPVPSGIQNVSYQLVVRAAEPGGGQSLVSVVVGAWAVGAAAILLVHLVRHHRFIADALRQGRPLEHSEVPYDVVASAAVDGPLSTGLIHPIILVPADFRERFTPEQQRLALLHEQLHHRRGDLWASAAALVVGALFWFNPLVYVALPAFRRDMEAACDARLLALAGPAAAAPYAETIVRCAARPVPRSLCALTTIDELKGRLTMIKRTYAPARRRIGLLAAAALTLGGMSLAASATTKAPVVHETKEVKIVRTLGGSPPSGKDMEVANCPGQKIEVSAQSAIAKDKQRESKIVLCGRKGASGTELATMIDGAVKRIQSESQLSSADKSNIIAQLQAKSKELRGH